MFVSRSRPVVHTQYEHARLSGLLAHHWGNEQFARPDLPFDAFCSGVAFHDHGYGLLDTHDILSMDADERLSTFEAMIEAQIPDLVSAIVVKMHIARLMRWSGLVDREAQLRETIRQAIDRSGYTQDSFERADTITQLCDAVAFDFCFEETRDGEVVVDTFDRSRQSMPLKYQLCFDQGDDSASIPALSARITLSPWPLCVSSLRGYAVAFERAAYPERLIPYRVPWTISPRP